MRAKRAWADKLPKTQLPGTRWTKVSICTLWVVLAFLVSLLRPGVVLANSAEDLHSQITADAQARCYNALTGSTDDDCVQSHVATFDREIERAWEACKGSQSCLDRKFQQIARDSAALTPKKVHEEICKISPADPDCNPADPWVQAYKAVVAETVNVTFNGLRLQPGVPPYETSAFIYRPNQKAYAPVRAVFLGMGMRVGFDSDTHEITATRTGLEVRMTIGSRTAKVNGEPFDLGYEPIEFQDRAWLPLRPLVEKLNGQVDWDGEGRTVHIVVDNGKIQPIFPLNPDDAARLGMPLQFRFTKHHTGIYGSPLGQMYVWFPNAETEREAFASAGMIGSLGLSACIDGVLGDVVSDDGSFWLYYQPNQFATKPSEEGGTFTRFYVGSGQHGMVHITERTCKSQFIDEAYAWIKDMVNVATRAAGK